MSISPTRLIISNGEAERHLVLEGDLDSHSAPKLDAAIQALGFDSGIVIELASVGFIDSSGLRVLITTHTDLEERGQQLALVDPAPPVIRLFEITGLVEHLHITNT
jgi:anti-sigma B factor antagonist